MKRVFASFLSLCLVAGALATAAYFGQKILVDISSLQSTVPTIIVDAGHGGEDGGAVGVGGVVEKDINLAVAMKLNEMLNSVGVPTITVRTSDTAVNDDGLKTVRERKVSDIHNRMKLINNNPDAIFVSIHQNHFTAEKYSGTQVFYSKNNPEGKRLAQLIQDRVVANIQPDNRREIKPAGTSIYLLHNAKSTAVLIECGFISNSAEAAKLSTDEYRSKIAFAVYCGILEYINELRN